MATTVATRTNSCGTWRFRSNFLFKRNALRVPLWPIKQPLLQVSRSTSGDKPPSPSAVTTPPKTGTTPTSPLPSPSPLLSPENSARGFTLLVATSALLAVLSLGVPELLLRVCYGIEASYAEAAFVRIAGAGLLLSVAIEYSLKDAAENGRLSSATYQRLLLIGGVKSFSFLAILALSPAAWTPAVLAFYPFIAIAGTALYSLTLTSTNQNKFVLPDLGLSLPTTPASWTYALYALLYLPTAAAPFAPEALFTHDAITPAADFVKYTWAPSFLAAAGVCWVLKDAADRGRLGATTFRWLNLGLAGLELGFSWVVIAAMLSGHVDADAVTVPSVVSSSTIVVFTLWEYFTAKKALW